MLPRIITLFQVPPPAEKRIALRVTPPAERAIREGHPWLFADSITRQSHDGKPGDLAIVFDRKGRFLAVGLYDPASPIRVRILQTGKPAVIDRPWLQMRIRESIARRKPLENANTDGYRLVHGENDGLPGLIIDRYEHTYVVKLYTAAWIPYLRDVLDAFRAVGPKSMVIAQRVILRLSRAVMRQEEFLHGVADGGLLAGPSFEGETTFLENGLRFHVDVLRGQKTGFFLDQRDNRAMVETLTRGKSVLNMFAYTGGFSLYAARGGATEAVSVDMSRPALETAVANFELNKSSKAIAAAKHETIAGDAFEVFKDFNQSGRRFDVVVIDPPAFAKKQSEIEGAQRAYRRLVRLGLAALNRNGILAMSSCSSRIQAEDFYTLVHETAGENGRYLQEIRRTGHPIDHPIGFPEGAYLKCLFAIAP